MVNHYEGKTRLQRAQSMEAFETWLLSFIKDWTAQFGVPPTLRDIKRASNIAHNTIWRYLNSLRIQGRLTGGSVSRTWKVVGNGS